MTDHKRLATSPEVWAVIRARHGKDLGVYGSFSDPDGTFNGGAGERGTMHTIYSLNNAATPLMEAQTTWTIDPDQPYKRVDEKTEYWLCLPQAE
jgi:hypothetical protein